MTYQEVRSAFQAGGDVEIEIGCGNGHFLAEYGMRNPHTNLIGIEIKQKRCLKAEEKARKRSLTNVAVVRVGAEQFIHDIPARTIAAFHIYFPDPWPKSRHRKRRFLLMENITLMHESLAAGGRIYFSTDFFDYYLQAKVLLLVHGGFSIVEQPVPEEAFASVYNKKFASANKSIYRLTAVKGSPDQAIDDEKDRQGVHADVDGDDGG